MMHERAHYHDEAVNHQLPIAAAFWIIWIVSVEECSRLMHLMQIHCSTHLVILNATATQYTSSLNGVYCPPLTSTVKSSLFAHAYFSPLSLAVRLHRCCMETVLIRLTELDFFLDRLYLNIYIYLSIYHLSIYLSIFREREKRDNLTCIVYVFIYYNNIITTII